MAVNKTEENNRVPRCLAYDRVSTTDQRDNGLSLETQKTQILKKIEELGGELVEDIYEDGGITGTSIEKRPAIQALMARCAKGDIDYVIVQDSSRISRNTLEYLVIKQTLKQYGTTILPLTGAINADVGPMGDVMDEMIAVVHSIVPRLTSYKVKQTAAEKFKAGFYPSMAPLGYVNIVNKNPTSAYDKRILAVDPNVAPFLTQAFKMYATEKHTIFSIREYLNSCGIRSKNGKPLGYSYTHNLLRNSFYWGWMKWGVHEGMGKHTPIIDKQTFDIVQRVLTRYGVNGIRQRKHNFLLRGVIFCNQCGRRYTAEWHVDAKKYAKRSGRIGYYHCAQVGRIGKCNSPYVEIEELEKLVEQEVSKLEFTQEFINAVKRNVRNVYEEANNRVKASKKAAYNRRDALEIKREKLEGAMLDGTLSRDRFAVLNARVEEELTGVQQELTDIGKIRAIDIKIVDEVIALTQNIAKTYKDAGTNAKRAYLNFFFDKIYVEDRKIVRALYRPVIDVLNKAKLGILGTNWLASWNDFRTLEIESFVYEEAKYLLSD